MDPQIPQLPTKKQYQFASPIELFKRAWSFYKTNFKKLWVLFLFGSLGSTGYNFATSSDSTVSNTSSISPLFIAVLVILSIAIAVFATISKVALLKSISDIHKGQFIGTKDAYKKGIHLFWPFILLSIMISASMVGASVLLIVPGLILMVYISFSLYELVDQDKRNFKALLGSWELVSGCWWSVAWRMIVCSLLVMLIGLVSTFLAMLVALGIYLVSLLSSVVATVFGVVTGVAVLALGLLLIQPLSMLIIFELYYDVRSMRSADLVPNDVSNKKRKTAIIASMVIGAVFAIAIVNATIFAVRYFADKNSMINSQQNVVANQEQLSSMTAPVSQ